MDPMSNPLVITGIVWYVLIFMLIFYAFNGRVIRYVKMHGGKGRTKLKVSTPFSGELEGRKIDETNLSCSPIPPRALLVPSCDALRTDSIVSATLAL